MTDQERIDHLTAAIRTIAQCLRWSDQDIEALNSILAGETPTKKASAS